MSMFVMCIKELNAKGIKGATVHPLSVCWNVMFDCRFGKYF